MPKSADGPTNRRPVTVAASVPGAESAEPQRLRPHQQDRRSRRVVRPAPYVPLNPFDGHPHPAFDGPEDSGGQQPRAADEAADEQVGRRGVQLVGRAHLLQPPRPQHGDPVAQLEGLVLLVGHEHRGDADAMDEIADLAPGPLPQRGIEIRERLVQQQHARLRRQRPGERHALLLAAGELADAPALEAGEVHQRERPRDPALQLLPAEPERLETEGDVLADVEMGKERVVLEHHAEPPGHRIGPGHVLAVDQDPAGVGRLESRQQPERRGLAAAAGPQQREDLASLERERDAVHRHGAVEPLGQPVEAEEGTHCSGCSFPVPRTCRSQ